MKKNLRIKRLERLWPDDRPICPHAFSLIIDGVMVQDDEPCSCGGERITLIAAFTDGLSHQEAQPLSVRATAGAKSV